MPQDPRNAKAGMASLKTRPIERNLALTRLGLGAGARIAAHEFANLFRGKDGRVASDRTFYVEQAQRLADELGRLKGSVMKVGQMLSLYGQYFLPEEAVRVLAQLQDDTPAVAWDAVAPILDRALGRARLKELQIERRPLASASLAQVHRARRLVDGLELVLKIQYPGVADAIESDITTMARLIAMTRLAPKGLNLESVYAEVKEMLHREVDYLAEARHTQAFGERLAGDARYAVPRVLPEYLSDQVLALTFEPGLHVRDPQVQALPQARRDAIGQAAFELFLKEFFEWGLVQTDPHFGNYKVRLGAGGAPDVLVTLDFGATRAFGRGFIDAYRDIVHGAMTGDRDEIRRGGEGIGLMSASFPAPVRESFYELCELIVEPFADAAYDWAASDLPRRVTDRIARNAMTRHFQIPPREIVFLHRRMAGVFILLATLRCRLNVHRTLMQVL
ncbi:MAG TPA: AarF/ABC1/UbiB kinase family protein [Candidatus Binatia bacterium]|nr:AarF/ABC1/UbiB kinase family protein [Candidatus Binatia bacterium]